MQKQVYDFRLKGSTSLSKGFQIIKWFSEDIDIYIRPLAELGLKETSNSDNNVAKREAFYNGFSHRDFDDGTNTISLKEYLIFSDMSRLAIESAHTLSLHFGLVRYIESVIRKHWNAVTINQPTTKKN